ncbi:hypothetical protein HDU86_000722 [Geranomyces michiganensis]|nr:hypothetical protein HDU86_000722 [Geranomyces michiganensis]
MMDIEMPVLSGWAATKLIRGEHRTLPIGSLMKEIKAVAPESSNESLAPPRQVIGGTASLPRRRAASISRVPGTRPPPPPPQEADLATSPSAIGARIIGENRLVPIVAITSVDSPELRASYFAAGMNDILIKPVTPSMVHDILGKYLEAVELSPTRALGNPTTVASARLPANALGGTNCQIYGGSKEVLLQALLEPNKTGPQYMSEFLLTFRSFMEPVQLLEWLRSHFKSEVNANTSASDLYVITKNSVAAQHGVANVLKTWVREQWHDFASSPPLKASLIELIDEIKATLGKAEAEQIMAAVDKQITKWEIRSTQMHGLMDPSNVSRSVQESLITADVSPAMLAEQLCLYDSMLFRHINAIEYVNLVMKKTSPTLTFLIKRFDKESYWVATEIVGKKDLKARVQVLRTFIVTAKECLEAQNYFSVFAIMFGLNLSPVQRLKKTWEAISDNKKKVLAELVKFTDVSKNFKTYRDKLEASTPPLIPFLPIFIKDLTFLNDGNESRLANDDINFEKLRLITDCVKGITAFAKSEYKWYNFDTDMQEYLTNPPLEMSMAKLQELSKIAEP